MVRIIGGVAAVLLCCATRAQSPDVAPSPNTDTRQAPAAAMSAPALQTCAVKAFDDYAASMSSWERQWANSTAGARPDLGAAAAVLASAHNSALQRDAFRIRYLAAVQPDSLDLDETIASLRLFDWTPEQEQALRRSQADYASAADAADQARRAADAQPRSDELENYFQASLGQSTSAGLAGKLSQILEQGNSALSLCRGAGFEPRHDAPATTTAFVMPAKS
jgi:hypothetical protein